MTTGDISAGSIHGTTRIDLLCSTLRAASSSTALTGDILYRLLAGVGKHESDAELEQWACAAVDVILGNVCTKVP
jgi:hypothetical protein